MASLPTTSRDYHDSDSQLVIDYFFFPAFAAQRQALIESLTELLPMDVVQNKQSLLNILVYGSDNIPEVTNFNIFSLL